MSKSDFKLDTSREQRIRMSEAIYCEGKTAQNIEAILMDVEDRKGHVLLTRLAKKKHSRINKKLREKISKVKPRGH